MSARRYTPDSVAEYWPVVEYRYGPLPLVPLHVTEKGVARIEASEAVKHPAVKAQLAAVAKQRKEDPERFCNKCGYFGPDKLHQRPNGTGECHYVSRVALSKET